MLILQEKAKLFSKVFVTFYIFTNNNEILLLHTLANAWYYKSLKKISPSYFIAVLIYISAWVKMLNIFLYTYLSFAYLLLEMSVKSLVYF